MLQHYVPRFYLARFVDQDGLLWVFDKMDGRAFRASPNSVAAEKEFYYLTELPSGADPQTLEKQLSDIEGEASRIIACWLRQVEFRTTIDIPTVNRELISTFLAIQLLRTAEARTQIVEFASLVKGPGSTYDPKEDARNLHIHMCWGGDHVQRISRQLERCIWIFGRNESQRSFFCSDHPALVKDHENKRWLLGPRVFDPGMYLVFPLSPKWILYCKEPTFWKKLQKFGNSVSPVTFTTDMVDHENSGQIGSSARFIYSCTADFDFARDYCKSFPNIKNPNRLRFSQELP